MVHSGMLETVRMLFTLSMQLQRAAVAPGGVSWLYACPNATALKTEARHTTFSTYADQFSFYLPWEVVFLKKNPH